MRPHRERFYLKEGVTAFSLEVVYIFLSPRHLSYLPACDLTQGSCACVFTPTTKNSANMFFLELPAVLFCAPPTQDKRGGPQCERERGPSLAFL